MPCSKYKSKKQRGLCYATKEWKDWSKIKKRNKGGNKMKKRAVYKIETNIPGQSYIVSKNSGGSIKTAFVEKSRLPGYFVKYGNNQLSNLIPTKKGAIIFAKRKL